MDIRVRLMDSEPTLKSGRAAFVAPAVAMGSLRPETSIRSSRGLGWRDVFFDERRHLRSDEIEYPGGVIEHVLICRTGQPTQAWQGIAGAGRRHQFLPGSITLLPAKHPCSWHWKDQQGTSNIVGLAPEFLKRVALEACDLDPSQVELQPHAQVADAQIEWIASQLRAEVSASGPGGRVYAESIAQILCIHLLRHYAVAAPRLRSPAISRAALRRSIEFLRARLSADLSLGEVARVAGMSPFHFARAFRVATGFPPHQYLIRLRAERARALLEKSDDPLSLAQIATEVGFCDQSHLTRHFRRLFGLTPARYRASF